MKPIIRLICLFSCLPIFGQSTIQINQSSSFNSSFTLAKVINPSHSQIVEAHSDKTETFIIDSKNGRPLEEMLLKVDNESFSFYVEPNGTYDLVIKNTNPLQVELNESNSEINTIIKAVDQHFKDLYTKEEHYQGSKDQFLGFLYLGRSTKNNRNEIRTINRRIEKIRSQPYYTTHKEYIDSYLASFLLINAFKKEDIQEFESTINEVLLAVGSPFDNPILLNSFDFIFGNILLQYFQRSSYYSNDQSKILYKKAFFEAMDFISKIDDLETRQLAQLTQLNHYYHSFFIDLNDTPNTIDPYLNEITQNPANDFIFNYAQSISRTRTLAIGQQVPDFSLISYEGDTISLSDLKAKYIYLDFWFSRCKPCIAAMKGLPSIIDQYQGKVEFVSINGYDDFDKGLAIADRFEFIGTKLHAGANHPILKDYNVSYYPTYYFISPEGNLLYQPKDYYKAELEKVLTYID